MDQLNPEVVESSWHLLLVGFTVGFVASICFHLCMVQFGFFLRGVEEFGK